MSTPLSMPAPTPALTPAPMTFAQLGAPAFVSDALERRGITEPFEIQTLTIADMLAGRDVLGRAPTGSGKTLAFGVPVVANTERAEPRRPRALILAPTRELAEQITTELRTFAGRLRIDAVYGGVGYGGQLTALRRGVDILVACPGRLEDLIESRHVDLSAVRVVVLDEADRMADMGFIPAVRRLLDRTPADRQTVMFSATLDGDVAKLTREYQRDPVRHEVGAETPDVQAATHRFWKVERSSRNDVVADVVKAAWPSIIFCRTRHGADRLAKQLEKLGVTSVAIHGGLSQGQRTRALEAFSNGRAHAMIATDVAARGIHVHGVATVIHYDPPEDHKAYVHRSGRTARAGAAGVVVSMVQPEQLKDVRKMQRDAGIDEQITSPDMTTLPLDGLDADRVLAPGLPRAVASEPSSRQAAQPARTTGAQGRDVQGRDVQGRDVQGRGGNGQPRGRSGRSAPGEPRDRTPDWSPRPSRTERDDRGSGSPRSGESRANDRRPSNSNGGSSRGQSGSNGGGNGSARGSASTSTSKARANRAARRAHLQPGTSPR